MVQLTQELLGKLSEAGLEVLHGPGAHIPEEITFEPPCSIKWMHIHHSLKMGAFSYAVRGFYFNVEIGRYTSIGEDVQIGRGDHPTDWVSTSPAFYLKNMFRVGDKFEAAQSYREFSPSLPAGKHATKLKLTRIGHDVYIGHGAFIRPGITIGHGAIVAANAVVVKDVPPYAVVAGNPAVVKKYRIPEHLINRMLAVAWWRFAPWQMKEVDFTDTEKALEQLESLVGTLRPYSPGFVNIVDVLESPSKTTQTESQAITSSSKSSVRTQSKQFKIVSLSELHQKFKEGDKSISGIEMEELAPASEIMIPAPPYGDSPEAFQNQPDSEDKCVSGLLKLLAPLGFTIKDCTVWSKYGVILTGDYLIRESLFHFPRRLMPEISFQGDSFKETTATISTPLTIDHSFSQAITTLSGIQRNYYHWFMFALPRVNMPIVNMWSRQKIAESTILVPEFEAPYQEESMKLLLDRGSLPSTTVAQNDVIKVDNLFYSHLLRQGGVVHPPIIKETLSYLKEKLILPSDTKRKIFISRRDSNNRRLINEDELAAIARVCGFEVVTLSGMNLYEQALMFANASHIIGAHGAGLTNIIFCEPGTKILELHMEGYVNWCYRRLCALYGATYGFISGRRIEPDAPIHSSNFSIPLLKFEEVLLSSGYLS